MLLCTCGFLLCRGKRRVPVSHRMFFSASPQVWGTPVVPLRVPVSRSSAPRRSINLMISLVMPPPPPSWPNQLYYFCSTEKFQSQKPCCWLNSPAGFRYFPDQSETSPSWFLPKISNTGHITDDTICLNNFGSLIGQRWSLTGGTSINQTVTGRASVWEPDWREMIVLHQKIPCAASLLYYINYIKLIQTWHRFLIMRRQT